MSIWLSATTLFTRVRMSTLKKIRVYWKCDKIMYYIIISMNVPLWHVSHLTIIQPSLLIILSPATYTVNITTYREPITSSQNYFPMDYVSFTLTCSLTRNETCVLYFNKKYYNLHKLLCYYLKSILTLHEQTSFELYNVYMYLQKIFLKNIYSRIFQKNLEESFNGNW